MGKKQLQEFERCFLGLDGGVSQYRKGIDEFFIPHGFALTREKLDAARKDLEQLGVYEVCRDTLSRVEHLINLGPDNDDEAEILLVNACRALLKATGTYYRFSPANDSNHDA